jgi:aerobic-type carbon monoxide dehydrogenase small subunit (CoxS/CutS family)
MSDLQEVSLTVNGRRLTWSVPVTTTLLDALRQFGGLMGAKEGCGIGECGACTVLVNGKPVISCLVLAVELGDARITTIESTTDRRIAKLREAFLAEGALQCGACTPGMVVAASRIPDGASADEIREALAGNLCRCTGYASTVRAVQRASRSEP